MFHKHAPVTEMLVAVGFLRRILRMDAAIAFWRLVFDPALNLIQ